METNLTHVREAISSSLHGSITQHGISPLMEVAKELILRWCSDYNLQCCCWW